MGRRPLECLKELGFKTAALALTDRSVPLDYPLLKQESRLALVMGTEGDGLPQTAIDGADYVARIPMYHGVDSLNVAAASAVAFWELRLPGNVSGDASSSMSKISVDPPGIPGWENLPYPISAGM